MPKLQVELSEEEYRRLNDWARGRGQSIEAWLRDLLRGLALGHAGTEARTQAFLEWVQRYASADAPPVPLESLSRENLYQEVCP